MNKTVKRILVIGAVIFAVIWFVFYGFVYCNAGCGDARHYAEQRATFQALLEPTCSPCPDAWKDGLPEGKLIFIIPKTVVLGKHDSALAIAFSPEKYNKEEIDEYVQSYLYDDWKLSRGEVNIIETEIVMDTNGIPWLQKANTPILGLERQSRYIDPDDVTVWDMKFIPQEDWVDGSYDFWFYISYEERRSCSLVCGSFPELVMKEYRVVKIVLQSQTSD